MKTCDYCTHVEMCGWRKEVEEQGCEFFSDGICWIPVSERLPKTDERVLVTAWGEVDGVAWVDEYGLWQTEDYSFHDSEDVTAWMPLPAPYKGGEEESGCDSVSI